jgi:hypothetical protein
MGVVKKIIDKEYLFNYSTINDNSLKKLFNSDCLIFLDKKSYKIHKKYFNGVKVKKLKRKIKNFNFS